ncbi:hypothetical protein E4U38_002850 [Claviceps purpurea]|nr:hypothetical protein E4U38_002850 [Claviceps purpurea]KAG6251304.1 hypothetical protein E4U23_000791 [Claviceps purpurea]KAG6305119.1 hypothetical protein E4U45_000669 [Claviceps purpurea]
MSSNPTPTQTGGSADDLSDFRPASNFDGTRWVQLSTQVDGHENKLTEIQRTVTVTQGDFTTLRDEVTTIRGDVTSLQGQFKTIQNVIAGVRDDITRTRDQAEVNARLEALNKNTVAGFHNRLNGSGSDNLEPL